HYCLGHQGGLVCWWPMMFSPVRRRRSSGPPVTSSGGPTSDLSAVPWCKQDRGHTHDMIGQCSVETGSTLDRDRLRVGGRVGIEHDRGPLEPGGAISESSSSHLPRERCLDGVRIEATRIENSPRLCFMEEPKKSQIGKK